MADKPILFSGPMVKAPLDGRKTQTRRVSAKQDWPEAVVRSHPHQKSGVPFQVGDRLYVREAWRAVKNWDGHAPRDIVPHSAVEYLADDHMGDHCLTGKDRRAFHMPRWASRLTLTVTDVRVQRLSEITSEDAIAEGIEQHGRFFAVADADWDDAELSAEDAYRRLWDHLNAERGFGWSANPWVVAVSFTVRRGNIGQVPA